jgi:hypothetical protein
MLGFGKSKSNVEVQPPNISKQAAENAKNEYSKELSKKQFAQLSPTKQNELAPGRYQEVRMITSWADVAPLLADLSAGSENKRHIRVKFPAPTAGDTDERVTLIEQTQIRNFLRENHGKPVAQIRPALQEKMEKSLSFFKFRLDEKNLGVTADSWIDAFLDKAPSKPTLQVTDIVSIPDVSKALETLTQRDIQATLRDTTATKAIPVIFEAFANDDASKTLLADQLQRIQTLWGARSATVWALDSALPASGGLAGIDQVGTDGSTSLLAQSVGDFIKKFGTKDASPDLKTRKAELEKDLEGVGGLIQTIKSKIEEIDPKTQAELDDNQKKLEELNKKLEGAMPDEEKKKLEQEAQKLTAEKAAIDKQIAAARQAKRQEVEKLEQLKSQLLGKQTEKDLQTADNADLDLFA